MEQQQPIAYHWTNQQGESRITHLTDEEDLVELKRQFLAGLNKGSVLVEPATGVVESSLAELIHQAFENIRQFIAEGLTPKNRVDRAMWVSNVLQNKEPLLNEEWDTLEENRKADAK